MGRTFKTGRRTDKKVGRFPAFMVDGQVSLKQVRQRCNRSNRRKVKKELRNGQS